MEGFKRQTRKRIQGGSEFHSKALEALIIDTLKKRSETSKKLALKRALKPRNKDSPDDDDDDAGPDAGHDHKAVALWVCDPCNTGHRNVKVATCDDPSRRKLAVIHTRTLEAVCEAAHQYIPPGRTVREIFGGLADPLTLRPWAPADFASLRTDNEVVAFLKITKAHPIRLLFVLHQNDGAPDTPLLNPADKYFPTDKFDPPEIYDEYAEDTDAIIRDQAGVGQRRMPTRDNTFEERKYRIRKHIERQQELLRLIKRKHREKFPNVGIIDSDHEDFCYIRHLKNPIPKKGPQLVQARAVAPVGRRATRWNITFEVRHIRAKVRGLNAAQMAWEDMNE